MAIEEAAGVTAMETSVAGVTVRPVDPLIDPKAALMFVLPAVTAVARPALMVATVVLVEVQETVLVRFCVVPSLYVPVAVNCRVVPFAIEALAGVTAMETSVGVTVRLVEPLIDPKVALMFVLPAVTAVARPALMVATVVLVEVQDTVLVRFCVLPSLYVPVAVNCWVVPLAIEVLAGVTAIDTNAAGVTVRVAVPLIELVALDVMVVLPGATPVATPLALTVPTDVLVADQVE
jgi:hypothetical protein